MNYRNFHPHFKPFKENMIYNFSSGPAMLPAAVMQQIHQEWFNWQGTGLSAVEWSHRAAKFEPMIHETKDLLAELLALPKNYKVLFLQGGASLMWSLLPMNLAWGKKIGYVVNGSWSEKAIKEGRKYAAPHLVAQSAHADGKFTDIAAEDTWQVPADAAFVHYCSNETIQGIQYRHTPNINLPLVCDMSSDILSRPIVAEKYGAIYAGAQKNMGVAGLTVLIIREDWLDIQHEHTALIPSTLGFKNVDDNKSLLNTPSTFAIYACNLVLKWMKAEGGVGELARRNQEKANRLYDYLDASTFYQTSIARRARSHMNVTFALRDEALQAAWLQEAEAAGLYQLKGHRLQGGLRASIYNAMPQAGVERLVQFMDDFSKRH